MILQIFENLGQFRIFDNDSTTVTERSCNFQMSLGNGVHKSKDNLNAVPMILFLPSWQVLSICSMDVVTFFWGEERRRLSPSHFLQS